MSIEEQEILSADAVAQPSAPTPTEPAYTHTSAADTHTSAADTLTSAVDPSTALSDEDELPHTHTHTPAHAPPAHARSDPHCDARTTAGDGRTMRGALRAVTGSLSARFDRTQRPTDGEVARMVAELFRPPRTLSPKPPHHSSEQGAQSTPSTHSTHSTHSTPSLQRAHGESHPAPVVSPAGGLLPRLSMEVLDFCRCSLLFSCVLCVISLSSDRMLSNLRTLKCLLSL
jgi:hypothetical protein